MSLLSAYLPDQIDYGAIVSSVDPKHSNLDILLSRRDRTYRPNELVEGALLVASKGGWSHFDINLDVTGVIRHVAPPSDNSPPVGGGGGGPSSSSGRNNRRPPPAGGGTSSSLALVEQTVLIKPRGRVCAGIHRIPFTFPLLGVGGESLLDTYHGSCISISYTLSVTVERGFFARTLEAKREFIVRGHGSGSSISSSGSGSGCNNGGSSSAVVDDHRGCVPIRITPSSITENSVAQIRQHDLPPLDRRNNGNDRAVVAAAAAAAPPALSIRGKFDRSAWSLEEEVITGDVTVGLCAVPIRSIEVRLDRIEQIRRHVVGRSGGGGGDGGHHLAARMADDLPSSGDRNRAMFISYTTEVQKLQIADGDVPRGVPLPIFMVLPPLLVCPTVIRGTIRIEYTMVLLVIFVDGTMVSETYPLTLIHKTEV